MPRDYPEEPYLGLDDIEAHTTRLIGSKSAGDMRSSAKRFHPGDVLYSRLRPYLNKVWLADRSGLCSAEFIVVPSNALLDGGFLKYRLNARDFVSYANSLNAGDRPRVDFEQISAFCLPPFSLAYQRKLVGRIEELFSELDAGEESLRRARRQLGVYRQSLLKQAFEGKLTAKWREEHPDLLECPDHLLHQIDEQRRQLWEELEVVKLVGKGKSTKDGGWKSRYPKAETPKTSPEFEPPSAWAWVSWDQIGISQNGRSFPSTDYCHEGTKLLRPGNLHVSGEVRWNVSNTRRMPLKWETEFPGFIIGGNELVMNLTAQSLADEFLGRVCLTKANEHCLLNQRIARLRTVFVERKFAFYLLKGFWFRRFVGGLNTGSLIQHMFTSQLAEFCFGLPSLPEQQEIVRLLDEQFSVIEENEREIDAALKRSEALRQSILKKAFTGQLVPQDPSDEPASVLLERIRAERGKANPAPKSKRARSSI